MSTVRKAFALVTSRERIINKLTKGGEKPAYHFVPNGVTNYQSPDGLHFDAQQARRLLAEAPYLIGALPELPRLLHQRLSAPPSAGENALRDLAATQRQRNALLSIVAILLGTTIALLVMRLL